MRSKILPFFIILILLAVGAFGFLSLGSMDHSEGHTCPVPAFSGSNCPGINSLSLAFHHLSGLQNLSQSTNAINLSVFFLLSIIFVFFLLARFLRQVQSGSIISYQKYQDFLNFIIRPKRQFIRWFVIHNEIHPSYVQLGI